MTIRVVLALLCAVFWATAADAQGFQRVPTCGTGEPPPGFSPGTQDTSGNACVNATVSVSASIAGFAPATTATPLSVTSTSSQEAAPAGATLQISNTGTAVAFVNLGTSGSVTATTANTPVPAGWTIWLTVGSNTNIAAITAAGSTSLNLVGGTGLGTAAGGGSGGGGSLSATASATPTSVSAGNANLNVSLNSELFSALSFAGTPLALGAATSAHSIPVVVASNQAAFPVTLPTGQQAMTASTPVVIASNQSAFPVTLPTGQAAMAASTPVVIASNQAAFPVNLPTGQQAMTASTPVVIASNQSAVSMTPGVTAAATPPSATTGTGKPLSISLNGELFTTLSFGGVPLALGSAASASSLPVVIANDQGAVAVTLPVGTALSAASTPVVLPTDQAPIPVKQPDVPNTGSMNTNGSTGVPYALTLGGGVQSVEWKVTGLTGKGATITPMASTDGGATYTVTLAAIPEPSGATFTTFTTDQSFCTNVAAKGAVELLVTTPGSSGTMNIVATASVSSCPITGVPQLGGTITPVAGTTGGATPSTILSAASNNSTSIKASPGTLYSVTWINTTTTLMDIRFYDTASAPTCSSATAMKMNFVVQSNATSPGGSPVFGPAGIAFANGIGVCITGANTNSDNSNAVTGLNLVVGYN